MADVIRTTVNYDGNNILYCIVENDQLATMLRNPFQEVQIDNITSITQFKNAIEPYVGDISDFQFIFGNTVSDYNTTYSFLIDAFPNIILEPVPTGSAVFTQDVFTFSNKNSGIQKNISGEMIYLSTQIPADGRGRTALTIETSYGSGHFTIKIPIFKHDEIVNNVLQELSGYIGWISITYEHSNSRVYIRGNRYDVASYINLNYFKNSEIPNPPQPPSTDPYNGGGYSGTGGGQGSGGTGQGGNYDDSSDPIPIPNLPINIATATGLFTAYNPSVSQLATFANKLWNRDPTTVDDWFRILFGGDAFNAIIGLHIIPVAPDTSGTPNIKLGNWDTGASAPKIVNQYKSVDFGSVALSEYWGNCIDYSPYTRVQLALPYIGIVDVDADDVIGSNNNLVYHIDVFSGALCAMLHCSKGNLSSVIYQWSGSCGVNLPVTGASFNAVISSVAGIAAAAAGTFALASGPIGAAIGPVGSTLVGSGMLAGSAANTYGSTKGRVQKSGAFSANSGALGIMTPYFIITRPVQSVPATWQATKGYPANISADLSTITGYTEVSEVHLHNIPGTKDEVLEIESLLKKGVIF